MLRLVCKSFHEWNLGVKQGQNQISFCKIPENLGKNIGFEGRSVNGFLVEGQQNLSPI